MRKYHGSEVWNEGEALQQQQPLEKQGLEDGEYSFAFPISRSISHLEFFWVSSLSHLPFANAQKVHQTDSNLGPHDQ